jgi:uncharacterized membrane protein (DUF2068 family)
MRFLLGFPMMRTEAAALKLRTEAAGLKTIAILEALKGIVVLLAAAGVVSLVHEHAQAVFEEIVRQFHLNPASRYPRIFLDAISSLSNTKLWLLALGAALYSTIRFAEAYGLWHARAWGEWLGVVSGCLYLPVEVYELMLGVSLVKVVLFVTNLLIVAFLARTLYHTRQRVSAYRALQL